MKYHISIVKKKLIILLVAVTCTGAGFAEDLRTLVNLKGYWKFSIGDDLNRAFPDFNDSNWAKVFVPQSWEENGYHNYNGYAWYRKKFTIKVPKAKQFLYLNIGYIDDADEVYINGQLVGASGEMGPQAQTAYHIPRMYPVPVEILNENGSNTIAVRVFDDFHEGGIIKGDVNISYDADQDKMDFDLSGYWKFETSASISPNNYGVITNRKGKIFLPGFWETRGYNNVDGRAVFSKQFIYPQNSSNVNKVLFVGVIDDVDEVYLNGTKIGSIRELRRKNRKYRYASPNLILRAYDIPENLLVRGGENIIEIIVEDHGGPGGIYRGPIGIVDQQKALSIAKKSVQDTRNKFEKCIDYWFD